MPPDISVQHRRVTRPGWRPLIGPGITTAVMLAILIALGTWQIYRLQWKEAILARIAAAEAAPAVPLSDHPDGFEKVAVSGRFLYDQAVWFGDDVRTLPTGPMMGYFQVVPLQQPDGRTVLVDRGWVPDMPQATASQPPGDVTVQGYVRPPEGKPWFKPADDVPGRHFYTLDAGAIASAMHVTNVAPFILVALGPTAAGAYPVPAEHLPQPPNNHLSYVLTWYGLAVALLVIFITWARKQLRA